MAVSQLRLPCFSTDRHTNLNRFKTNLHLSLVSTTPEIEIDFRDVQNPILAVSRGGHFPTA